MCMEIVYKEPLSASLQSLPYALRPVLVTRKLDGQAGINSGDQEMDRGLWLLTYVCEELKFIHAYSGPDGGICSLI